MKNPTVREFLYPMRNAIKGSKIPLKIIMQACKGTQVLYTGEDAAGEFKINGVLLDKIVDNWYIQDGTIVIDLGGCSYCGVGYDGSKSIHYCSYLANRQVIDGRAAILYPACSLEICPLLPRKNCNE